MSNGKLKAITFDLWDTVFIDESDEPKRIAEGFASKPVSRRNFIHDFIQKQNKISIEMVNVAYDVVDAAFRHVWYEQNTTWTVAERLEILLNGLGYHLPLDGFDELVRQHEDMEVEIKPDIASGIKDALSQLHDRYLLGVISDTIFTPGRGLRQMLDDYGLLKYFKGFVFSDEIGFAKPAPIMFEAIAKELKVELNQIVHIGDREEKDVDGPHAVGAKAILTTVIKDRASDRTKAEAICTDYSMLPEIIKKMELL